jgi:broad-specificity NMP kinase
MAGNGTRPVAHPRRLVELAGPAGAGKSTIARLLRERDPDLRRAPGLWSLPRAPLGFNTVRLLPRVLGFYRAFPPRVWGEIKQIIRLDTLYRVVGRNGAPAAPPALLDEGPVLAFGWFDVYGDARVRRPAFGSWRAQAVAQWGAALDVVVLLDASDDVLVDRIRSRGKGHGMKHKSDAEIAEFVRTYRAALAGAVAALGRVNGLAVWRIETDDEPPEASADRVLAALRGDGNGH